MSARTVQRAEATGRISHENLRAICAVLSMPVPVPEGRQAAVQPSAASPSLWLPVAVLLLGLLMGPFMPAIFARGRRQVGLCLGVWLFISATTAGIVAAARFDWGLEVDVIPLIALCFVPLLIAVSAILVGAAFRAPTVAAAALMGVLAVLPLWASEKSIWRGVEALSALERASAHPRLPEFKKVA